MDRETIVGRTTGDDSAGESPTCQGDYSGAGKRTPGWDATRREQVFAEPSPTTEEVTRAGGVS